MAAMLAEADALPSAQTEPAVANRHGQRTAEKRGLDVRRHVVGAFLAMPIGEILGRDSVQHASRSTSTSGSAFSLMVNEAEVCLMKICSKPIFIFANSGRLSKIGREIEWQPFGKEGSWISR